MKILVFSDSHGNPKNIADNIRVHKNAGGVDHIFFLGDGVRDFLSAMDEFPEIPYNYVFGNCDFGMTAPAEMKGKIYECAVEVGGKKFLIMHGHRLDVKTTYQRAADYGITLGADVLLFGHTHQAEDITIDGSDSGHIRMINPGSCAKGLCPTYACIEIAGGQVVCGFGRA
ncbi:MAG: YfcE family phosphodiesterase [Clostridia bacterium]|nr:YfcE family phosphodiesterase [Clostridia bacterium]